MSGAEPVGKLIDFLFWNNDQEQTSHRGFDEHAAHRSSLVLVPPSGSRQGSHAHAQLQALYLFTRNI